MAGQGGGKNEAFRRDIVPHMSKIVYYPNAGDIFNIRNLDGICYYLADKNTYSIKDIKNIDFHENHTLFNQDWHESNIKYTLHNELVNGIIAKTKVNTGQNIKPYYRQDDTFFVHVSLMLSSGGGKTSFSNFAADGKLLVLNPLQIKHNIASGNYKNLFSSKNEDECKSFISYVDTLLIRFILYVSCCGNSVTSEETWRFVPAPDAFDHIFTDKELYKKYNLTPEEIAIIESVIKERKQK